MVVQIREVDLEGGKVYGKARNRVLFGKHIFCKQRRDGTCTFPSWQPKLRQGRPSSGISLKWSA